MSRSPIAALIDASVRCGLCGTPGVGTCRCWVTLECEVCHRTQLDERIPEYFDLDRVMSRCPDCRA